jgi:hypothetical protein
MIFHYQKHTVLNYSDLDPGSFLTLDPGWKNLDPGSGINISDPQHWLLAPIGKNSL